MRKLYALALAGTLSILAYGQQETLPAITATIGEAQFLGTSPAVRNLKENLVMNAIQVRDENGVRWAEGRRPQSPAAPAFGPASIKDDPVLQSNMSQANMALQAALGANFNGMGFTNVNPPDPSVAVGPNHVIQMINGSSGAYFRIYDKTGTPLNNQTYLDNLTGRGGLGDPIVLYDQLADRFVMTEFANRSETGSEGLVVAVSATADPLGAWHVYYFSTGTTFPDYPKFSVWPDAYYATSNDFANASSYNGSSVYAFDRSRMLAGLPVTSFQTVKFSTTSFTKYFAMCPVLLQGTATPPAGTGGLIAYMFDDSWTSTTADRDSIGLLEYRINWSNPSLSTLVNLSSLQAADFKSQICTASRGACVPQPGTTTRLEALQQRVMNQPIYRNFGNREGIVFSHVLDKGSNITAIRWYEMQKTTGTWSILQQSTYGPDNVHRWMPSIAYDAAGNIGLAFNVSDGSTVFPGVRYTGRRSCDPLNTMTYAEAIIIAGTSRNASSRYGDYNHLVADPDGNSFWFTAEWNAGTTWSTRVANFALDNCSTPACDAPGSLASSNITAASATLSWAAVSGAASYTVEYKASTATTWLVAASATTSTSINLTGLSASTIYNWRVRTNCSSNSSGFTDAQFTTAAAPCNAPGSLAGSNITATSATLSWAAVSGAASYTVEYKASTATTWLVAASATTSTSISLTGLSASTTYDWRVRTNCSSTSSSFSLAQFTTAAEPVCAAPGSLSSTSITSSSATVSWAAISGAASYTVEYKVSTSSSWMVAASATTSTSINLTGLSASTTYDWRVRTNCSSSSSSYSVAQFTTLAETCADPYEPNNTRAAAAAIPVNADIRAIISTSSDNDYFKFSNTSTTRNIQVTLTNLTRDYDIELYRTGTNNRLARSQKNGTANEIITFNTTVVGQYEVRVYGYRGANDPANCYTLKVALSGSNFGPSANALEQVPEQVLKLENGLQAYPNPAKGLLNIAYEAEQTGKATFRLVDAQGRTTTSKVLGVQKGTNLTTWDVSHFAAGVYMLRVQQGARWVVQKVIIARQ